MKVLLAVDGSDHARRATELVASIGEKLGADVLVLHCHERDLVGRAGLMDFEAPEETERIIQAALDRLRSAGVKAEGRVDVVHFGGVPRRIVEAAKEVGADLIAMGTRGESDLEAILVGGVAHKVIHLSQIPVLVVR